MARIKEPPASLEAKTKDELRLLMIANDIKHTRKFHYFDFSFATGKWHCWYEISLRDKEVKEAESGKE